MGVNVLPTNSKNQHHILSHNQQGATKTTMTGRNNQTVGSLENPKCCKLTKIALFGCFICLRPQLSIYTKGVCSNQLSIILSVNGQIMWSENRHICQNPVFSNQQFKTQISFSPDEPN